jgi:hypothetical protein
MKNGLYPIVRRVTPDHITDIQTREMLRAYKTQQKHEPRPTQAELEAACKAGRAEYDAGNVAITPQFVSAITTAPRGWTQIEGGNAQ